MAFDTSQFHEFRYGRPGVLASTFGISLGKLKRHGKE